VTVWKPYRGPPCLRPATRISVPTNKSVLVEKCTASSEKGRVAAVCFSLVCLGTTESSLSVLAGKR
jgi:hypothetical protein